MQKSRLEAWLQVLEWNQHYPVGRPVIYDSPWLGEHLCFLRSEARVISTDVASVWVTGHAGAVRLDKLRFPEAAGVESFAVVQHEWVSEPLLQPLYHSPTHLVDFLSKSKKLNKDAPPAELPSRLDTNCRTDLTRNNGEDVAEPTLHYEKEWNFGEICIRVSVMTSAKRDSSSTRHENAVKAGKARGAQRHAQVKAILQAKGKTLEEYKLELNRIRVQRFRENQAAKTRRRRKAA